MPLIEPEIIEVSDAESDTLTIDNDADSIPTPTPVGQNDDDNTTSTTLNDSKRIVVLENIFLARWYPTTIIFPPSQMVPPIQRRIRLLRIPSSHPVWPTAPAIRPTTKRQKFPVNRASNPISECKRKFYNAVKRYRKCKNERLAANIGKTCHKLAGELNLMNFNLPPRISRLKSGKCPFRLFHLLQQTIILLCFQH